MLWRAWSFLAGAPVGVLAALAFGARSASTLAGAAAASAALWLGIAAWIARARDDDPARPAHVAGAAGSGLLAAGALAGAWLHLAPGPVVWLVLQLALSAGAFVAAARRMGPSGGVLHQLRVAVGWLALGPGAVLAAAVLAAWSARGPDAGAVPPETVYDLDAQVATRPLPVCDDGHARARELHPAGARPRLDPSGDALWFDATTDTGRRQVHRFDLDEGSAQCITCDEPGNNLRPDPGPAGVLFETDRFATPVDATNRELQLLRRGPGERSRRLTLAPGPDGHALWAPGAGRVVWTRRGRGQEVVWARVQSAHGALLLGPETVLARGGVAWIAAAAWSPDARALALLSGNPFGPVAARALDPATGEEHPLGDAVVPGGVAFSADGGVVVVASARRRSVAGLLPTALAAPFAPLADFMARDAALFRDTRLAIGETGGALEPLPVAELERWGAPTGVAMSADGTRIYLGQRATDGRERLLEIQRDCPPRHP